jgi:glutamyl-tRNA synthetase
VRRLRFAHAPGTPLHLAGARLALLTARFARHLRAEFRIRVDDAAGAAPAAELLRDLAWLGLEWSAVTHQSDRVSEYAAAIARLQQAGRLYPCFETPAELEAKRDQRVRRGKSPVYDRAMLKLTPEQRARAEAGGKVPYWRFLLSGREMAWDDLALGRHTEKLPAMSDPILLRADGTVAAALASAVDDAMDGITHLVRGAEQAAGTAVQLDIAEALGFAAPKLAHLPPLLEGGAGRARRPEGVAIRQLRADGFEPEAVAGYLASLGAPEAGFSLGGFAPARFEMAGLLAANRLRLGMLDHAAVAARLPAGAGEAFWLCVRGHLDRLPEARGWWDVVAGDIVPPVIDDVAPVFRAASALLPPEPWGDGVWAVWRDATAAAAGRTPPEIAPLLRLALTGEESGPDMASLLPLIGRARAMQRLELAGC